MRSFVVIGAAVLAIGGIFALNTKNAEAFLKYSQKEKKPCSYCHVRVAGGGKRTVAGEWYKNHNLSFAGFKPAATPAAKPSVKPTAKPKATAKPKPKASAKPKKKG